MRFNGSVRTARTDAIDIFNAGVRAAAIPDLRGHFGRTGGTGGAGRTGGESVTVAGVEVAAAGLAQVVIVGAGKAAPWLSRRIGAALANVLPRDCRVIGVSLAPAAAPGPAEAAEHSALEVLAVRARDVNEPTTRAVEATRRVLAMLRGLGDETLVVGAFTGGGSATLCAPASGLTLADQLTAVRLLARDGATIGALNTLRRHLSAVKGGRLAEAAAGARAVVSLLVSDVDGDAPQDIASGPAVPDPTTYHDALALRGAWPAAVRRHLMAGCRGEIPETPATLPENVGWAIVRSPADALQGAAERARERGYDVVTLPRRAPPEFAAALDLHARALRAAAPGTAILSVGEAPPPLPGKPPAGGRAGHLALALALASQAAPRPRAGVTALVGASDGEDGTSGTSGAVVDAAVLRDAVHAGRDPARDLARCESLATLLAGGGALPPQNTGTNVQDLRVMLVGDPRGVDTA